SSSPQPTTMNGRAILTSSKLRSAREPISQSMISVTAQGLGASDRASDTPALDRMFRIAPARMKVTIVDADPDNSIRIATPSKAPLIAAIGRAQGARAVTP